MSERCRSSAACRPPGRAALLDHPLVQLTLVRVREFAREPEAVFWALFFPILLTAGLGIAFRSRPPEVLKVATTAPALARGAAAGAGARGRRADRRGGRAGAAGRARSRCSPSRRRTAPCMYRYDETNPEGRAARALADARRSSGPAAAQDPVPTRDALVREPGSRYIDFLVPGLVGLGHHEQRPLGHRLLDRRRAAPQADQAAGRDADVARPLPGLLSALADADPLVSRSALPVGFGALVFGVPVRGRLIDLVVICVLASLSFSALGLLIACRARTIEAVSNLMNLVQVPMWILSGVFFSAQRFPGRRAAVHQGPAADRRSSTRCARTCSRAPGCSSSRRSSPPGGVWLVVCLTLLAAIDSCSRWR